MGDPRRRGADRAVRALSIATGLILWEVAGRVWGSDLTVPPLSRVVGAAPDVVGDADFRSSLWITLRSTLTGLAVALPLGYVIGVAAGLTRAGRSFLRPYLVVGMAAPTVAAIPVIVAILGLTTSARVVTVLLFAVPVMAMNTSAGYQQVPTALVEMARSFGIRRWEIFRSVRLPASMPAVLTGARLSVGRAYIGVIVAELLVLTQGLGRLLLRYNARFETSSMYFTIVVIVSLGIVFLKGVGAAEKRFLMWRTGQ